jgi:hypothetical protein
METLQKKKSRIKKNKSKDKALKLALVFAPVTFFLLVYFLCALAFDYTSNTHSRLNYNEKVEGLLNMLKDNVFDEKPAPKNKALLQ